MCHKDRGDNYGKLLRLQGYSKGKKNACYAFFGSMSCVEEKWIVEEGGTDEAYTVQFEGNCKWAVDAYCTPWDGEFPVILPENADEAMAVA